MKNIQPLISRYEHGKNPHPTIVEADVRYLIGEVYRLQEYEGFYHKLEDAYYRLFEEEEDGMDNFWEILTSIIEHGGL